MKLEIWLKKDSLKTLKLPDAAISRKNIVYKDQDSQILSYKYKTPDNPHKRMRSRAIFLFRSNGDVKCVNTEMLNFIL